MIPVDPRDYSDLGEGDLGDGFDEFGEDDDSTATYAVRPYAVTGGRTRPSSTQLPMEALVQSLATSEVGMTPEKRRIIELTKEQYLSVAELSAHIKLPVGVVRVIISDLSDEGKIRVHGIVGETSTPAHSLSVLESVLNGISAL